MKILRHLHRRGKYIHLTISKADLLANEPHPAAVTNVFYRKLSIDIASNKCQSPYDNKTKNLWVASNFATNILLINFYFPWNHQETLSWLIRLILEAKFGDDSSDHDDLKAFLFLFLYLDNRVGRIRKTPNLISVA